MNICFLAHYTELFGANRSLLHLLAYFKSHHPQVDLHVIVPGDGPLCTKLDEMRISYQKLSFNYSYIHVNANSFRRFRTILSFFFSTYRMFRSISWKSVDIVYSNSSVVAHGLVLARLLNKKHIWHIREFGRQDYNLVPVWGNRIQQWLFRQSHSLIFVSHALKKAIAVAEKNCRLQTVVYNGVNTNQSNKLNLKEFPGNEIRICFAGFMSAEKMAEEAINLMEHLERLRVPARLIVCSEMKGPYAAFFQNSVKKKGFGNQVEYKGFVDNLQVILASSHFLIMPSRNEAMGRVTAEAMAVGTPVIGFLAGGTSELFEHGKSGIHYRQIADAADYIHSMNSEAYHKMCRNAHQKAVLDFSSEKYGASVYEVCRHLVNQA